MKKYLLVSVALLFLGFETKAISFTVGGATNVTNGNYSTIQAAYNACNVASNYYDNITINSNYNPALETFPINFALLPNRNLSSRLTIYMGSSTPFLISRATTIFSFNGCNNVVISGSDGTGASTTPVLTIQNTSTASNANTVQFINGATNNAITNCNIYGSNAGSVASSGVVLFGGSTGTVGNSSNEISNCTIGKDNQTNMPYQIVSSAGTSGKENHSNRINSNNFVNFSNKGIYIDSVSANANTWSFFGNSFYQTADYPTGRPVIVMDIGSGFSFNIDNSNYMGGQAPMCGGTPFVIPSSSNSSFTGVLFRSNCIDSNSNTGGAHITNISLATTMPSGIPFVGVETRGAASYYVNLEVGDKCTIANTENPISFEGIRLRNSGRTDVGGSIGNGLNYAGTGNFTAIRNLTSPSVNLSNFSISGLTLGLSNTVENVLVDIQTGSVGLENCSFNNIAYEKNAPLTIIRNLGANTSLFTSSFYNIAHNHTSSTSAVTLVNALNNSSIRNCTFNNLLFKGDANHALLKSAGTTATFGTNEIRNIICPNGGINTAFCLFNIATGSVMARYNRVDSVSINTTNPVELALFQAGGSAATFSGNVVSDVFYTNKSTASLALKIFSVQGSASSGTISQNIIRNLSNASTSPTSKLIGIEVLNGSYNVHNNVILLNNKGASNPLSINGILLRNATESNTVYHNTIKIFGTQTGNAASAAISRIGAATANVRNNVFQNFRTGGTLGHYTESTIASGYTTDFNYLESGNLAQLCSFGGTDKTLATWKTSTTATNSSTGAITLDPNGRLPFNSNLVGANMLALVPVDVLGGPRTTKPILGAYESETLLGITNVSPLKGNVGSTVILTGSGFMPKGGIVVVRFGDIKANVVSTTDTKLVVTVPSGATYGKLSVVVNGLVAQSTTSFLTTNTSNCSYFELPKMLQDAVQLRQTLATEFDDDGIADFVGMSNKYSTFKTDATPAIAQTNTFGNAYNGAISVGDLNRDGALDFIAGSEFYINNGLGVFSPISQNQDFYGAKKLFVDLNKDGILDKIQCANGQIAYAFGNQTDFGIMRYMSAPNIETLLVEDVNGDGYMDIIGGYGRYTRISIQFGTSKGAFGATIEYSTGKTQAASLSTGDLDNDGDLDIAVCAKDNNSSQTWSLLLNANIHSGTFPTFTEFSTTSKIYSVLPADINGDGNLDLVTANFDEASVSLYLGNGTGVFSAKENYPAGFGPSELNLADMNKDGMPDVVVTNNFSSSGNNSIRTYGLNVLYATCTRPRPILYGLSTANGQTASSVTLTGKYFDPAASNNVVYFGSIKAVVTAATPTQLTVTVPAGITLETVSVTVAGKRAENTVRYSLSSNALTCVAASAFAPGMGLPTLKGIVEIEVADLNNDGKKDIVSLNATANKVGVYLNTTTTMDKTQYAAPVYFNTGTKAKKVSCADMDNDGYVDIVVAHSTKTLSVYKNSGNGTFAVAIDILLSNTSDTKDMAIVDLNLDGYLDIVCMDFQGSVCFTRNLRGEILVSNFVVDHKLTVSQNAYSLSVNDLDGDRLPDIMTSYSTNSIPTNDFRIYKNYCNEGGVLKSFASEVFSLNSQYVFTTDINADNKPDLVYLNKTSGLNYKLNSSTNMAISFNAEVQIYNATISSVTMGDIDGDGKPDLAVFNGSRFLLYKNNFSTTTSGFTSGGTIAVPSGFSFQDLHLVDGNIDTKPDIIVSAISTNSDTIIVYKNWIKPTAIISGVDTICSGTTSATKLKVALTGLSPWTLTYKAGTRDTTISTVSSPSFQIAESPTNTVFTPLTTNYTLVSVSNSSGSFGCTGISGTVSGIGKIVTNAIPTDPKITSTPEQLTRCGIGSVDISAQAYSSDATTPIPTATINWYLKQNDTLKDTTSFKYTTPNIGTNTTFYAESEYKKCFSKTRTPIEVVVNARPILTSAPAKLCNPGRLTLTVTPDISGAKVTWYDKRVGGVLLTGGNSYTTDTLRASKKFYVKADFNGCSTTDSVMANIYVTPVLSKVTSAIRCDSGTIFLSAQTSAGTIYWYDSQTSTSAVQIGNTQGFQNLTASKTMYIQADNNGCASPRVPITATIINTPKILTMVPASRCDSGSVTLAATSSGGIIKWYNALAGGDSLFTGKSYTTPKLKANTNYYLQASDGPCVAALRTPIAATVIIVPAIQVTASSTTICAKTNVNFTASVSGMSTTPVYQWKLNGKAVGVNSANYSNANLANGDVVSCELVSNTACLSTAKVVMTVNPTPTYTISKIDPKNCGEFNGSITLSGLTPQTNYVVSFQPDSVATLRTSTTGSILKSGLPAGSYAIRLKTNKGCAASDTTLFLADPNAPTISAGVDKQVCEGANVTLTAFNPDGATITWKDTRTDGIPLIVKDGIPFTAISTRTIQLLADKNGCKATDDVTIKVKEDQTISFAPLSSKDVSDVQFDLTATSTSDLPVTFLTSDSNIVSISGSKANIINRGTVTITAFQGGDKCFNPSVPIDQKIKIGGATTQTIVFGKVDPVSFGDKPFKLGATSSLGLPIRYKISDTTLASLVGDSIVALKSGIVTVTAFQDAIGNDTVKAAIPISQTVQLYVPPFVIIGKKQTEEFSLEKYKISPKLNGLQYDWSYSVSDTSSFFTTGRNNNSADILFSDKSPNDTLRCKVYNANKSAFVLVKMPITISHPNVNQLPAINCDSIKSTQNTCSGNFIDGFEIGEISNSNSGCSAAGYADYSKSPYSSKLFLGESYNADFVIGSNTGNQNSNYIGIWIDYNNNGSFNDPSEFLLSAYNANSRFQLNNILISANSDYLGEHRIRVRTRTSGLFAFNESCIDYNETGETEDYKVTLVANDRLEAPVLLTPNDDGKNDFFVLKGIDSKQNSKLTILDRSGNVLHVEENYTNTWGGKDNNGKILPRDTYYYVFVNGDNTERGFFEIRY